MAEAPDLSGAEVCGVCGRRSAAGDFSRLQMPVFMTPVETRRGTVLACSLACALAAVQAARAATGGNDNGGA